VALEVEGRRHAGDALFKLGFRHAPLCLGELAPLRLHDRFENVAQGRGPAETYVAGYDSGISPVLKGGGRLHEIPVGWVLGGALLAVMLAGAGVALRWRLRRDHGPIYPTPPRYPIANWTGPEVALAMLLFTLVPSLVITVFQSAGLIPLIDRRTKIEGELLLKMMAARAVAVPIIIAAALGVLWSISRTRPKRLGLRLGNWRRSLYLGYTCYLVVVPIVQGVNLLADWLYRQVNVTVLRHPLQELAQQDARPGTLLLVMLVALVLAPVAEELLFRGVMLPWLGRRWWGGWAAMAGSIVLGLAAYGDTGSRAPLAFALTVSLAGIAFTFPHAGEQWVRRAIIGTGLLFAMMHYQVWPHPVPLFILGVALGWLAHRSRGLLAPIVLHSLFNATSVLMILFSPPPAPPEPAPQAEALSLRPSPGPTHTALPPRFPGPDGHDAGTLGRWLAPAGANSPNS
jgi:membrane protease YdiL (CAAX protease family)